jgi:hypothetical protein
LTGHEALDIKIVHLIKACKLIHGFHVMKVNLSTIELAYMRISAHFALSRAPANFLGFLSFDAAQAK